MNYESLLAEKLHNGELVITVIGLGYVGLPLAVAYGKKFKVHGFDLNKARIEELASGQDHTLEQSPEQLAEAKLLTYTTNPEDLRDSDVFIVTVPTPIDQNKRPDLTPLVGASTTIGKIIKNGAVVIYESTTYPGCTEEDCIPVIEKFAAKKFNEDFFAGYSPERINPGDKVHTVTKIKKVTSGSTPKIAEFVDNLYNTILENGTHRASSIKVAEASKIIENCQRDINIAFVNELSRIFHLMGIDTLEVLEAAGSKWNFLPFRPGLVGGHCIGVDPYYLTHKAQSLGYHADVINSGRRINDEMGAFAAREVIKIMIQKAIPVRNCRVLVLGVTFKENCPDIRNSRVIDIIHELQSFGCNVTATDPWVNNEEFRREYNFSLSSYDEITKSNIFENFPVVIFAVKHDRFAELSLERNPESTVLYDVKCALPCDSVDGRL